jgi:hypothetical protein
MANRITSLSVAIALLVSTASYAEDVNGAAKAFSQAQEAMLAGDAARAADLYELADELAPSATALRNAARARLAANHDAMAATLAAELLRRYPNDKDARDVAEAILGKLGPSLAQFEITCSEDCMISLDGKATVSKPRTHHAFFAQPGARTVSATFDGNRQTTKQVSADAGKTMTLTLDAPPKAAVAEPLVSSAPPQSTAPAPAHHGIARTWLVVTGLVTVGLGVATGVEGAATLSARDDIKAAVAANDNAKATSLYDSARSTQLRTNILIGATAAAGVATVVLAFFTDWSGKSNHELAIAPTSGGAAVAYGGHF